MTISLDIDPILWQYAVDKFNSTESTKITKANEFNEAHHKALMLHTPVKDRTNFTPVPDFVTLSVEDYVIKVLNEKESETALSQTADHIAIVSSQSPETIARFAKVANLPDKVKEKLAAQVDAL